MYLHVAQLLDSVRSDLVVTNNARGLVYVGRGVLLMSSILPSFVGHERWCGPNGRALRYKSMDTCWNACFPTLMLVHHVIVQPLVGDERHQIGDWFTILCRFSVFMACHVCYVDVIWPSTTSNSYFQEGLLVFTELKGARRGKPEEQEDVPQHEHSPPRKRREDRNPKYHEEQQKGAALIFAAHPQENVEREQK
jgi:hypothetical protein